MQDEQVRYKTYRKELGDYFYSFQDEGSDDRSNCWLTCALLKPEYKPEDLIEHLSKDNIEARRIWKPMHKQPVLTNDDLKRIIKSIKTFFDNDKL